MARLIWSEPALTDLEEIAEYIALDNYDAAQKLVRRIFNAAERLKSHPKSGRKPPELHKTAYRELIVNPCRIFYKAENEDIYILYIMRGERSLRNYILEERARNRPV